MSKDPAFLFYPGDYLRDTQLLSEKAQVAYDRIMCEHMRNICIRQQQLNFLIKRLDEDEKFALMELLTKVDGGYQIEWVAESIEKRRAYSKSRRDNRLGKRKNICGTHDLHMKNHMNTHMENENEVVNEVKDESEVLNVAFADFWKLYNKKCDQVKCERKWKTLTDKERDDIMACLPAYVESTPDKNFRKDPFTFLDNRSWNNEIILESEDSFFS